MDTVLAGILAVPLHLAIEVGDRKGRGKLHATVALYAPDDVVGRGIKIRPAAMVVEFEFFTMRGYSRDFAAAFPISSVEAARIQRTITPEYMCQGCD